MNQLTKHLISELVDNKQVVAIFGGGFKPPTKGHFAVVEKALEEFKEIDKFLIYVGSGVRNGITQEQSMQVWDYYKDLLGNKVEIQPSKEPVREPRKYAKQNPDKIIYFILGERNKKDKQDIEQRTKNIEKYSNIKVKTIKTPDLTDTSGTEARKILLNPKSTFEDYSKQIPDKVPENEKQQIFNLLKKGAIKEGTCEYDTDAKTGKKLNTPGGLDEANIKENYDFKISDEIYDDEDNSLIVVEYKFSTGKNTYKVVFSSKEYNSEEEKFDISFGLDKGDNFKIDTFQMTGENKALSILKTVFAIIEDFENNFQPNKLVIKPTSEKRGDVYLKIIKSLPLNIQNKIEFNNITEADSIEASKKKTERLKKIKEGKGGANTSWTGINNETITLQDILELTKDIKIQNFPTKELASIVLNWDNNPEEIERISQVEVSSQYPILIMVDEQGKIQWILDGNHRAQKALSAKAKTIPAKLIKPSNLNSKARKILLGIVENVAPNHSSKSSPYGSGYKPLLLEISKFMVDQGMEIRPLPKVQFVEDDITNAQDVLGTTAYYNPQSKTIVLYTLNRHPKDILRSFCHEMIHHEQNLNGTLGYIKTQNTTEDSHLDKIERKAYEKGNIMFRNWTDSLSKKTWQSENPPVYYNYGVKENSEKIREEKEDKGTGGYEIYCDMDGVLCDFNKRFKEFSNDISPKKFETQHGKKEFWKLISEQGVGFWVGIPWMSDGKELWEHIKPYNPSLLSAPSSEESSRLGKRLWVKNNIPGTKIILCPAEQKQEFAKPNAILIDDKESNIEQWNAKGGIGILHISTNNTLEQLKEYGL